MSALLLSGNKKIVKRLIALSTIFYFLLFGLINYGFKPNDQIAGVTLGFLYVMPVFGSFISCLWASKNTKSYGKLWRMMATGMFFWLMGTITMVVYAATLGPSNIPPISLADVFSVAYLPIILGVLLSLGKIRPPFTTEKKQFLVNITMMSLAMLLLCYQFILIPAWYSNPGMSFVQRIFTIAYPIIDWIVLVSLLFTLHRFRSSQIEGWFILLIAAFTCNILADVTMYFIRYWMNPVSVLAMATGAILISMSALDEVTGAFIGVIDRPRAKTYGISEEQALIQSSWRTILVPLMATIVIPIVWLASLHDGHNEGVPVLVTVSTAIIMLSIYRNHLLASDNAMLFTKALRDSLTGLNNHRYFQEALSRAIIRSDKVKKPVSLLVLDIDDFDDTNRVCGHAFGDMVLTTIGRTIISKVREDDEACRLGGDNFAIIVPDMSSTDAYTFAEQLRESINNVLSDAFPDNPLTITIGVSTYPTLAKNKDNFVCTADGALYWGKLNGKNTTFVYDPEVVEVISAEERARKAEELLFLDMVRILAKAVDARDPYTRRHSQGVSAMASRLASKYGLDKKTVSQIKAAGILHDVGKIGMPDDILVKPDKLTDEEISVIKNHPALSAQIIQSTSLKDMVPAIRAHHERWDGKGYPDGLKGEEIPLEARILAIADTFDAMTTDRPYRKALSIEDALIEIHKCAGTQFDPKLAETFLTMFSVSAGRVELEDAPADQAGVSYDVASGL
ncbi:MAG: diguanylate cyclase [Actinobacteria bacterium]|nr:diguanylate cyclase [Actinomycetota bacterium]